MKTALIMKNKKKSRSFHFFVLITAHNFIIFFKSKVGGNLILSNNVLHSMIIFSNNLCYLKKNFYYF